MADEERNVVDEESDVVDKDDVSSPSLGDFVADVVYGIDPYIIHDGAKYHKSSLVNSILNSSTKLLSSDRNVRSICKVSSKYGILRW